MKNQKLVFKNRFFVKMLLAYCIIFFVGLGFSLYIMASRMTEVLIEMESRVDYEVVERVKFYSDEKYEAVFDIFTRLYMKLNYNNNNSIVDYLNPLRQAHGSSYKNSAISSFLQDTCSANKFISDIFIVDYTDEDVYFFSNVAGRDVALSYDFYGAGFFGDDEINNKIRIIPNHIASYISYKGVNQYPVISFGIYLFDENSLQFNKPLGYMVINMRADFFKGAYQDSSNFNGTIYVVDQGGMTLFDSSGGYTGQEFPFAKYDATSLEDLVTGNEFIINTRNSEGTGFTYVDVVNKEVIENEIAGVQRGIRSIVIICMILPFVISIASASVFSRRINNLVENMRGIENGWFDTRIKISSNDEIGFLEHSFNSMCEKLEEYIQNVYVFQLKTKTAELKALQSQIDPHFLFNTLESIRMAAQINEDVQTAKMIHLLGNMFRWNIKEQGMFVDLSEEFDYMKSYLELQKLRYDNLINLEMDIEPGTMELGVPKLILQPLVENAINHGLKSKAEGGTIRVASKTKGNMLMISVSDNGQGMSEARMSEVYGGLNSEIPEGDAFSIGLSNVHQRLRILFGESFGISITSRSEVGTEVKITVPVMSKEEMEKYVQSSNSG